MMYIAYNFQETGYGSSECVVSLMKNDTHTWKLELLLSSDCQPGINVVSRSK